MSRRAEIKIWTIDEFGFLVRGTTDEIRARAEVYRFLRLGHAWQYDPVTATRATLSLVADEGRIWRMNPCHCGYEHRFDLGSGREGQRGSFRAVYLREPW